MNKAKKNKQYSPGFRENNFFFFFRESFLIKEENPEATKEPYLMIHIKKWQNIFTLTTTKKVKNQKLRKKWCGGYVCVITEGLGAIRTFTHSWYKYKMIQSHWKVVKNFLRK